MAKFGIVLCTFILFAGQWISLAESVVVGQYEQFCTTDTDCNQVQGLSCQNQRCKCAPGGETVFSMSKNRCVGSAGRECLRTSNESLCVDNSICRDYNYMFLCVCSEGYYQSRDGNCYKIAKFGESCREEDYACGDPVTTSISCVDKKCSCLLGENQYYNPLEARCISYPGSQCLFHYQQPCSSNSYCGEISQNINGASFVIAHKCLCNIGFSYTLRSKKCLARFGTQCSTKDPCNYDEHLGCLNGICQCRDPLSQVLDEKSGQCRILVGSKCIPDSGPKCVQNAECVGTKDGNGTVIADSEKCQCVANKFSPTPLGSCLLDINQKCEPGTCNHYNALTCVNETCACVDSSLTYDTTTKVCYAGVGMACGQTVVYDKSSNSDKNEQREILVFCEGNASCSKNPAYAGISSNGALMKRICKNSSGSTSNSKS